MASTASEPRDLRALLDFLVTFSPGDDTYIVGPYHATAAAWLNHWAEAWSSIIVGDGICLDIWEIRAFISDAMRAGFRIRILWPEENVRILDVSTDEAMLVAGEAKG